MSESVPIVDVSRLTSPDRIERAAVAAEVGQACRTIGFFYVTGHGIPSLVIDAVFAGSRQFFALPHEQKEQLSFQAQEGFGGYVGIGQEQLDLTALPDRKEVFNIGLELLPEDPRRFERFRSPNIWPELPNWREKMLTYYDACWALGRSLHRAFSIDLGLDEDFFEDKLDFPLATLRLLHYPAASDDLPSQGPGAGEHTDYGNLTLLAVDGVGGLELRTRAGKWISAPSIEGALICNVGDCLMRWTNDVYISTPHRVCVPTRDRYSLAFFLDPNADALVVPVIGGEAASRRYPAISGGDYLHSRLEPTHVAATHRRDPLASS